MGGAWGGRPPSHYEYPTHPPHPHSEVKRRAEVLQPGVSTWEAKKNRHSERHSQLSQEAGNGGSTARCSHTPTHPHRLVKRHAQALQPNASTWEAVTKEFG